MDLPTACAQVDYSPIYKFAQDYGAEQEVQRIVQEALEGDLDLAHVISGWIREQLRYPFEQVFAHGAELFAPVMLLALLRAILPDGAGGGLGAAFLMRLRILSVLAKISLSALQEAETCLAAVKRFTDIIAPSVAALLAAIGMEGSAALVSPAAALAGNIAGVIFAQHGLPLCRIALCTAIAGNLGGQIKLSRFSALFRRFVNWSSALATTLFTALLALQGSMGESLDSITVRTAKFAVDSAAPVIGSGVSDAWESYVSGILIGKNALGLCGIAALLFACMRPLLLGLAAMLLLSLLAAVLDVFGEDPCAAAAAQFSGICQMSLSLCTAALAIGTILLGAAMSAGKTLLG